jgi:hypothetical protein
MGFNIFPMHKHRQNKSFVRLIFLFVTSILVMRLYFEFLSQSRRIEETVMGPSRLQTKQHHSSRYEEHKTVHHSDGPKNVVIQDMNSYASKHQSSHLPSYSSEYRNHRKTYEYEASILMGTMPRPYRFDDNLYFEINKHV